MNASFSPGAVLAPLAIAGLAAFAGVAASTSDAEEPRMIPPPAVDEPAGASEEVAVVAGGCFWGVQGVFQHVYGVVSAVSGYAGAWRRPRITT